MINFNLVDHARTQLRSTSTRLTTPTLIVHNYTPAGNHVDDGLSRARKLKLTGKGATTSSSSSGKKRKGGGGGGAIDDLLGGGSLADFAAKLTGKPSAASAAAAAAAAALKTGAGDPAAAATAAGHRVSLFTRGGLPASRAPVRAISPLISAVFYVQSRAVLIEGGAGSGTTRLGTAYSLFARALLPTSSSSSPSSSGGSSAGSVRQAGLRLCSLPSNGPGGPLQPLSITACPSTGRFLLIKFGYVTGVAPSRLPRSTRPTATSTSGGGGSRVSATPTGTATSARGSSSCSCSSPSDVLFVVVGPLLPSASYLTPGADTDVLLPSSGVMQSATAARPSPFHVGTSVGGSHSSNSSSGGGGAVTPIVTSAPVPTSTSITFDDLRSAGVPALGVPVSPLTAAVDAVLLPGGRILTVTSPNDSAPRWALAGAAAAVYGTPSSSSSATDSDPSSTSTLAGGSGALPQPSSATAAPTSTSLLRGLASQLPHLHSSKHITVPPASTASATAAAGGGVGGGGGGATSTWAASAVSPEGELLVCISSLEPHNPPTATSPLTPTATSPLTPGAVGDTRGGSTTGPASRSRSSTGSTSAQLPVLFSTTEPLLRVFPTPFQTPPPSQLQHSASHLQVGAPVLLLASRYVAGPPVDDSFGACTATGGSSGGGMYTTNSSSTSGGGALPPVPVDNATYSSSGSNAPDSGRVILRYSANAYSFHSDWNPHGYSISHALEPSSSSSSVAMGELVGAAAGAPVAAAAASVQPPATAAASAAAAGARSGAAPSAFAPTAAPSTPSTSSASLHPLGLWNALHSHHHSSTHSRGAAANFNLHSASAWIEHVTGGSPAPSTSTSSDVFPQQSAAAATAASPATPRTVPPSSTSIGCPFPSRPALILGPGEVPIRATFSGGEDVQGDSQGLHERPSELQIGISSTATGKLQHGGGCTLPLAIATGGPLLAILTSHRLLLCSPALVVLAAIPVLPPLGGGALGPGLGANFNLGPPGAPNFNLGASGAALVAPSFRVTQPQLQLGSSAHTSPSAAVQLQLGFALPALSSLPCDSSASFSGGLITNSVAAAGAAAARLSVADPASRLSDTVPCDDCSDEVCVRVWVGVVIFLCFSRYQNITYVSCIIMMLPH